MLIWLAWLSTYSSLSWFFITSICNWLFWTHISVGLNLICSIEYLYPFVLHQWGSCVVKWNDVYVPKQEGGLVIRRPKEINEAFLAKWLWYLLVDIDSLCFGLKRTSLKMLLSYLSKLIKNNHISSVYLHIKEQMDCRSSIELGMVTTLFLWYTPLVLGGPLAERQGFHFKTFL